MTRPRFTHRLPTALYTAAQVRELDRQTIAAGVPGIALMTQAGEAAHALLCSRWPRATRCVVLCGSGNNGGDGYVVARLALQHGLQTQVLAVTPPERLGGDARLAWEAAQAAGVSINAFDPAAPIEADVIVDAVLGTGLQGEVRGDARAAIEQINAANARVLAIDIPSGLCADTGRELGVCVRADATLTFIGMKAGLLLGVAPALVGDLYFAGLEVPERVRAQMPATFRHVTAEQVNAALPLRARDAHKGHFGHVLVVGGDLAMGGAVLMAAEAAARTGAGLTSVATRAEHVAALLSRRPELMVHPVAENASLQPLLDAASVVVVGPGLGRAAWGEHLFRQVLAAGKPMVIDADGLYWLARLNDEKHAQTSENASQSCQVLTPHPGEAARLLQTDTSGIQADRVNAVRGLQARYGGVVVLKGAGTLICDHTQALALATVGNPGMATGGMGDVLSGIIGGLLAQKLPPAEAAAVGVWLHGIAADDAAAQTGERGLLATDLFAPLRRRVNPAPSHTPRHDRE